jgi:hypothetical protein
MMNTVAFYFPQEFFIIDTVTSSETKNSFIAKLTVVITDMRWCVFCMLSNTHFFKGFRSSASLPFLLQTKIKCATSMNKAVFYDQNPES